MSEDTSHSAAEAGARTHDRDGTGRPNGLRAFAEAIQSVIELISSTTAGETPPEQIIRGAVNLAVFCRHFDALGVLTSFECALLKTLAHQLGNLLDDVAVVDLIPRGDSKAPVFEEFERLDISIRRIEVAMNDQRCFSDSDLRALEVATKRLAMAFGMNLPATPVANNASVDFTRSDLEFTFARSGDMYVVSGFGKSGSFPKLKGMKQIHQLVSSPGEPISLLTLDEIKNQGQIDADKRSVQPVFDADAKRELRHQRRELDAELETAGKNDDLAGQERVEKEIQALETHVKAGIGFRGKDRDMNNPIPGLRSKIRGTLKTAFDKIRKAGMDELADHLEASIVWDRNKCAFVYLPAIDPAPDWQTKKERPDLSA